MIIISICLCLTLFFNTDHHLIHISLFKCIHIVIYHLVMKLTALVFTPICVAFYPHQDQGLARGEALTLYSQLCITAARPEHAEEQGSSPGGPHPPGEWHGWRHALVAHSSTLVWRHVTRHQHAASRGRLESTTCFHPSWFQRARTAPALGSQPERHEAKYGGSKEIQIDLV